jgi:hypothetical protein
MTAAPVYGCHSRKPYAASYLPTGGSKPIPHVLSRDCCYTHSDLGQADPKCAGCCWRVEVVK